MSAENPTNGKRPRAFKLPPQFAPVAFSFYMSGIMAFLMCLIITAANKGFASNYLSQALQAYKLAMPAAFVCVLAVRPLVFALVKRTVRS